MGGLPYYETIIYSNIDATTSEIGENNIPICFNGGSVENDVWLRFRIPSDGSNKDFKITLVAEETMGIINPQVAIYRGDCVENQLSELGICASTDLQENNLTLVKYSITLFFHSSESCVTLASTVTQLSEL